MGTQPHTANGAAPQSPQSGPLRPSSARTARLERGAGDGAALAEEEGEVVTTGDGVRVLVDAPQDPRGDRGRPTVTGGDAGSETSFAVELAALVRRFDDPVGVEDER